MLPLDGITVVSLEQAVAAPFAARQLADLGARVIKIERPGSGDFARAYDTTVNGLCSHFVWLNRSKESISLDLKHAEAQTILAQLVAGSDVFIQNLAPGAADRLGFSSATLRERHPRLITCTISGYGTGGSYQDKKAYDLLVQAESGVISITGTPESPAKVAISIADIAAGMYAYTGILTALFQRERTGEGAAFEVSLFEALAEWMGFPAYYAGYGGKAPARSGASHATIMPYGPFDTGDGKSIFLAVQNEREWVSFCANVLEQPELTSDPRFSTNAARVEHRDALHQVIEAALSRFDVNQVEQRLETAGIANSQMRTVEDFLAHPQLKERNRWREVGSAVGPLWALRPPVTMDGVEPRMDPIPAVGEHTNAILAELGYSAAAVAGLRRQGAI
ncbi:MAG: CoA transferase [Dehalococcoidia bacterium]|nr:CoA transferase [Dehalococcoidia bacterium]